MALTSSKFSRCAWVIATTLVLALPTASQAYTIEQEEMCSGDAMRLCSADIPDVGRITTCMERQRESLSAGCKAVFETDMPATANEIPADEPPAAKPSKPIQLTPKFRHS